jgi:hypothetical protein
VAESNAFARTLAARVYAALLGMEDFTTLQLLSLNLPDAELIRNAPKSFRHVEWRSRSDRATVQESIYLSFNRS